MMGCRNFHQLQHDRRALLRLGALGIGGLSLANALGWNKVARASPPAPRAKSIIFLHQCGGPSHIDTFDLKPHAPDGIRGEFRPISSSIPGVPICEHLPKWGETLHLWGQIRSVRHNMKNHNSAGYYCLTGHAPPSDDIRLRDTLDLFPSYGSTVAHALGPTSPGIPPFVAYPHIVRDGSITPGQHASFLGKSCDPFFFQGDPNSNSFRLPELHVPANIGLERLVRRRELAQWIDEHQRMADRMAEVRGWSELQQQAFSMLTSPTLKNAFSLDEESDSLRDAYGRTTYGQSCLLARRLIERGVRFVTVYFSSGIGGNGSDGWDTHQENFKDLRSRLLPATDLTVPTLIRDLQSRGLLEETIVLWMGEFGRGPKIGDRDGKGRGHWPECYTVMIAGGGIRGGTVFGASDDQGAYPVENPVGPEDIAATLYWAMGIDPHSEIYDTQNRPLPMTPGNPIQALFT